MAKDGPLCEKMKTYAVYIEESWLPEEELLVLEGKSSLGYDLAILASNVTIYLTREQAETLIRVINKILRRRRNEACSQR